MIVIYSTPLLKKLQDLQLREQHKELPILVTKPPSLQGSCGSVGAGAQLQVAKGLRQGLEQDIKRYQTLHFIFRSIHFQNQLSLSI